MVSGLDYNYMINELSVPDTWVVLCNGCSCILDANRPREPNVCPNCGRHIIQVIKCYKQMGSCSYEIELRLLYDNLEARRKFWHEEYLKDRRKTSLLQRVEAFRCAAEEVANAIRRAEQYKDNKT